MVARTFHLSTQELCEIATSLVYIASFQTKLGLQEHPVLEKKKKPSSQAMEVQDCPRLILISISLATFQMLHSYMCVGLPPHNHCKKASNKTKISLSDNGWEALDDSEEKLIGERAAVMLFSSPMQQ